MSNTTYKKTESGWEVSETSVSGVCFFMGWDRFENALSEGRPPSPELSKNERIVAITPDQYGLNIHVKTQEE